MVSNNSRKNYQYITIIYYIDNLYLAIKSSIYLVISMTTETFKLILSASLKTIGYLFLLILFGLFFDSYIMAAYFQKTQLLVNFATCIAFGIIFGKSSPRIRELMVFAVIIGVFGEYLFSLGLKMYTYRLGNIPLYVPPGHAIVYITVIYFCKQSIIKKHRKQLEKLFKILILIYGSLFLIFAEDIFGFVMTLAVVFLLKNKPRERLFFFTMYIVVAFLEIVGTSYQCWHWPSTAYGVIPFLKSANPPSGISLFYFLLDLGCLWFYKLRHLLAWKRMKNIRRLRLN